MNSLTPFAVPSDSKLSASHLHYAIVRHMVDHGYAPECGRLASHFGVEPSVMKLALEALQNDHGVVLHPHAAEVWVIHPFATTATPFVVRQGERLWWGNCAWCSLGIAALLGGNNVIIQTTLGAEGKPVSVHIDGGVVREELWVHFPIPMARAWDNVLYTCSTMLVFDSETASNDWSARHNIARGDAQPIQNVYDFAKVWYGSHLDPEWRKWTAEEAQGIFEKFGLTGPIWQIPASSARF